MRAYNAVAAFNAGQFNTAEKLFDAVTDPYARALGYLWLASHPNYEEELRLIPKALALLSKLAKERPQDLMLAEFVEQARRMDRTLYRFTHRADEQHASVDVLKCDRCGGRMRILCAINPPDAIRKILDCLGLPSKPPPISLQNAEEIQTNSLTDPYPTRNRADREMRLRKLCAELRRISIFQAAVGQ